MTKALPAAMREAASAGATDVTGGSPSGMTQGASRSPTLLATMASMFRASREFGGDDDEGGAVVI
jgi:hypothetical protein